MLHSGTRTNTTTTTTNASTSALGVNTRYIKTLPGIFKLLQLILSIINMVLLGSSYKVYGNWTPITFLLLITVTFFISTFLLLLSCMVSIWTASIIAKTTYEFIYHGCAALLYFIASVTLLVKISQMNPSWKPYHEYYAAGVIGVLLCALYIISAIFSFCTYKGILKSN